MQRGAWHLPWVHAHGLARTSAAGMTSAALHNSQIIVCNGRPSLTWRLLLPNNLSSTSLEKSVL